jgi:hypothetical protein
MCAIFENRLLERRRSPRWDDRVGIEQPDCRVVVGACGFLSDPIVPPTETQVHIATNDLHTIVSTCDSLKKV